MAVEHARQALILDPEFWIASVQMAQAYEQLGKTAMAFDALRNAERFSDRNSKSLSLRGYLLATSGRANEAREVLGTLEAVSRERDMPPYALALVHAGLGERDAVFEWLDRAYVARDVHLIFLTVDPQVGPLSRRSPIQGSSRALWLHRIRRCSNPSRFKLPGSWELGVGSWGVQVDNSTGPVRF